MANPLPVIDILNNAITLNNYLRSVCTTTLPAAISGTNAPLVDQFVTWQNALWDEYFLGFLDSNLIAQVSEINQLYALSIASAQTVQGVLYPPSTPTVPGLVDLCDDLADLIGQGNGLCTSLEQLAQSIQNADQQKVNALLSAANALSSQFDDQEDKLTQQSIDTGIELVGTVVDVAVAVGTEGEEIEPLIQSVTKLAQSITTEIALTADINNTLTQLESAWLALDEESAILAQVTLAVNKLKAILDATSAVMTALNDISNDWSLVCSATQCDAATWQSTNSTLVQSWATQMGRVTFATASQVVAAPSS
jgi:hypothetical protein